ncbi:unnamed protein product, partial [Medioppia subpectinata]
FTDCFKNHLCFPDSLCAHIPEKGREYLSTNPNLCTIANIVMNLTTKRLRTIRHIIIRGDPYTRGHSYGQQLKEKIVKNINYYKELYHLLDWTQVEEFMNKNYVKALNKYFPSGLQEMRGIAAGAEVSLEDIIALNARYELMKWNRQLIKKNREQLTNVSKDKQADLPPAPHECTSAVCLSKATQSGDVLMGQNWDQNKRMLAEDMLHLLEVYPDPSENKVPFIMLTEVGQLGRSGITGMSIFSSDDVFGEDSGSGYIPISLFRRMFLEAPTFPVAILRLMVAPRHVSVNMTVASAEGEAFNIEMTPKHYFVSYPPFDTDIITHSNLFKSDAFFANGSVKDTYNCSSSLIRDRQMQRELLNRLGTIDEKSFTDCFKNHLGFPDSLCAHTPEKGREDINIQFDTDGKKTTSPLLSWRLHKGIILSILSAVCFAFSSVIVKYLKDISPSQLAVFRFVGIFVLTIPLVIKNGGHIFGPKEVRHILVLRCISGATSLFLEFYAFRLLPLVDASIITFSIVVFVSMFACVFLKESCGIFQTIIVVLTMFGVILTTKCLDTFFQPTAHPMSQNSTHFVNSTTDQQLLHTIHTSNHNHLYGVLAAFGCTFFGSLVFIFIRQLKDVHYSIIMFNFGWISIILTLIMTAIVNGFSMPKTLFEWGLSLSLGLLSFSGQALMTLALQSEQAGPVAVVRESTDIILSFVFDITLFHIIPDIWSISGATVVFICILLTAFHKWLQSRDTEPKAKS